jgi:hypothetical protein
MPLSKIQASSINLADTFSFTGSVTGTPQDFELIANTNAAGATYVEFTSIGSFTNYMIWGRDINLSADTSLYLTYYIGGTRQTSGYRWRSKSFKDDGNDESANTQSANEILVGKDFDNASSSKNQLTIWFSQLTGTTTEPSLYFENSGKMSNGTFCRTIGFGTSVSSSSGAVSGFRIHTGSGTYTTASFSLYGVATS